MTTTAERHADGDPPSPAELQAQAARDLRDALGWLVFGAAVLIGSIRMDRLEAQHINPYTVPGLLPGLLGLVMILLGVLLAVRSWDRGARLRRRAAVRGRPALDAPARRRDRPDPGLHRGAARPRPAVLARLGPLRHRLDRAAAGAAAGARRSARSTGATSPSPSRSASAPASSSSSSSRSCSWCACRRPERRPCSPDSPTSPTPGSAS